MAKKTPTVTVRAPGGARMKTNEQALDAWYALAAPIEKRTKVSK